MILWYYYVCEMGHAEGRIRTGVPLRKQILSLSPLTWLGNLRSTQDHDLTSGKGPTGVAAAAIYIASLITEEERTQRAVAEVAGVTEVTIRNRYKELTEKLSINVEQ